MNRDREEIERVVFDPCKRKALGGFDDEVLRLIVEEDLTENKWEILRQNNSAYLMRGLVRAGAVDRGSPQAQLWEEMIGEFKKDRGFIPAKNLKRRADDYLPFAKREWLSHYTYPNEFGIEVVGVIPHGRNDVHVLALHNQIKPNKVDPWNYPVLVLDSEEFQIPKKPVKGLLKVNPRTGEVFYTIDPLSPLLGCEYHDVPLNL